MTKPEEQHTRVSGSRTVTRKAPKPPSSREFLSFPRLGSTPLNRKPPVGVIIFGGHKHTTNDHCRRDFLFHVSCFLFFSSPSECKQILSLQLSKGTQKPGITKQQMEKRVSNLQLFLFFSLFPFLRFSKHPRRGEKERTEVF